MNTSDIVKFRIRGKVEPTGKSQMQNDFHWFDVQYNPTTKKAHFLRSDGTLGNEYNISKEMIAAVSKMSSHTESHTINNNGDQTKKTASLAEKIENIYAIDSGETRKRAHIAAMVNLFDTDSVQEIIKKINDGESNEFLDAFYFLYHYRKDENKKSSLTNFRGIEIKTLGVFNDIPGDFLRDSFNNRWKILMSYVSNKDVIPVDKNEAFTDFINRFQNKWDSLTPLAQAWATIEYLSGVRYLNVYVIKLLPLELMNIEILKMYLSFFESHLNNYKKENKEKKSIPYAPLARNIRRTMKYYMLLSNAGTKISMDYREKAGMEEVNKKKKGKKAKGGKGMKKKKGFFSKLFGNK